MDNRKLSFGYTLKKYPEEHVTHLQDHPKGHETTMDNYNQLWFTPNSKLKEPFVVKDFRLVFQKKSDFEKLDYLYLRFYGQLLEVLYVDLFDTLYKFYNVPVPKETVEEYEVFLPCSANQLGLPFIDFAEASNFQVYFKPGVDTIPKFKLHWNTYPIVNLNPNLDYFYHYYYKSIYYLPRGGHLCGVLVRNENENSNEFVKDEFVIRDIREFETLEMAESVINERDGVFLSKGKTYRRPNVICKKFDSETESKSGYTLYTRDPEKVKLFFSFHHYPNESSEIKYYMQILHYHIRASGGIAYNYFAA
jgi:hypothetical protein